MSQNAAGNLTAAQNGITMENIIRALYPQAEFEYRGLIDLSIDGVRVEIKSCQDKTKDNHNSAGTRSGRFCFNDLQHQELIENSGEYILLVHRGGIPFLYFRVPAHCLDLGEFSGIKSVCWKTLIGGILC